MQGKKKQADPRLIPLRQVIQDQPEGAMGDLVFRSPDHPITRSQLFISLLSSYLSGYSVEADQVGEHGGYFERHLVAHREQRYWFALLHFYLIVPRVELDTASQGQGRQLVHVAGLQLRGRGCQGRHAQMAAVSCHAVAEMGTNQPSEFMGADVKGAQEEAGAGQ